MSDIFDIMTKRIEKKYSINEKHFNPISKENVLQDKASQEMPQIEESPQYLIDENMQEPTAETMLEIPQVEEKPKTLKRRV